MTLAQYYGFPEGTKITFVTPNFYDIQEDNYPCPEDMSYAFSDYGRKYIKQLNTSNVIDMSYMFHNCLKLTSIPQLDTSNVIDMNNMFHGCRELTSIPQLDTSNVTKMNKMFDGCSGLTSIPELDTSNVIDMSYMFNSCSGLTSIPELDTSNVSDMNCMFDGCGELSYLPALDCGKLSAKNRYPLYKYSGYQNLTYVGGFLNAKMSWDNTYGLSKIQNLSYQSCINILNGLYNFTGNGETPTSQQGVLKVHANFLTTVGDEISIGTNKGWSITA